MRTPTTNRHLPWEAIRRDWETTSITMVALARRYGVASTTTLTRRREAEGWKRDVDPGQAQPGADRCDVPHDGDLRDPAVAHGREAARSPTRDHFDRAKVLAIQVQETGSLVLERLQAVLQPPGDDEVAEAVMLANLQCLIRVNPERDSLAGLLTAATKAVEAGVMMERQAITAEAASKPAVGSLATPAGSGGNLAREILQGMNPETVAHMRAWGLEVQRKRREAQIAAAKAGSA